MKHAILLAAILALPAIAQEKDDVQVSPATAARCKAEGGCVLVSRKVMDELLQDAYREGISDTAKHLEGMTCRKEKST
jgi:hypothetical protein